MSHVTRNMVEQAAAETIAHLEACSRCRSLVEVDVDLDGVLARILDSVEEPAVDVGERYRFGWLRNPWVVLPGAAVLVALVFAPLIFLSGPNDGDVAGTATTVNLTDTLDHLENGSAANSFMSALARGDSQHALGLISDEATIEVGEARDKAGLMGEVEFAADRRQELTVEPCEFISVSDSASGTDVRCSFTLYGLDNDEDPAVQLSYAYEITVEDSRIVAMRRSASVLRPGS